MSAPDGTPGPPVGRPHSLTPPTSAPPTGGAHQLPPIGPAGTPVPPPGSNPAAPAGAAAGGAWQMPLAGLLTAAGIAFLIVGLFAMASSADVGAIGRSDEEKAQIAAEEAAAEAAAADAAAKGAAVDAAKEGAVSAPNGGAGQDVYADPDPSTEVPGEGDSPGFSVDCSEEGVCVVESETGDSLYFADDPSKLPPGTEPGDGNVLVPNPNGGIAGFKVNPDGSLELVPRGEEDFDTYGMAFGPDGSVELLAPGQKPGAGTDLMPSNPGQLQRGGPIPDLGEPTELNTPNGDLTVECGAGGCRVTSEDGEELYMLKDGVGAGQGLTTEDLTADGKTLVPDPNGDIVGFRLNEDGELELVPRGEEDENTMGLVFGEDGTIEVLPPGAAPGLGTELIPGDPAQGLGDIPDWDPGTGPPGGAFGPGGDAAAPFNPDAQGVPGAGDPLAGDGASNADGNENDNADNEADNADDDEADNADDDGDSFFGGWTAVLGGILIAAGLLFAVMTVRRRNPKPTEAPTLEAIEEDDVQDAVQSDEELAAMLREAEENRKSVEAVDHLLVALRSEQDPRRAIQVAYAAVETGFGRADLARTSTDTPAQYLDRALGRMSEARAPLFELTGLFELARYSNQPVDEVMRERAIAALVTVRDLYSRTSESVGSR